MVIRLTVIAGLAVSSLSLAACENVPMVGGETAGPSAGAPASREADEDYDEGGSSAPAVQAGQGGQTDSPAVADAGLTLLCSGGEPMWGMRVWGSGAMLRRETSRGVENRQYSGAWTDDDFSDGAGRWSSDALTLDVKKEACAVGGVAGDYSMDLSALYDGEAAPGCCSKQ